ncbi:hypothetical protein DITRI_Ditri01bG0010300 [Diplodiscus trichospermus]
MNGFSYSKMKVVKNENSRSMKSSDLMLLPEITSKPTSNPTPNPTVKNPAEINPNTQDSSEQEDEQEAGNNGEMLFGPKLTRSSSISSAYAIQTAVKRAFSMRRYSSVSERYCRIHDQSVTLASPFDDEELDITGTRRSVKHLKKKNSRGKILKAWKKLLGL